MSESTVITTGGQTGLVKADFGFRLYLDGVATPAALADVTVAELGSGEYRVDGLPDGSLGRWRTLTWETPAGVGGFHVYPHPQSLSPPSVVVPVREAGLVAADLDLALYKDGILRADVLIATEVGSPGDYRIAGWPTDLGGDWSLFWRRAGLSFPFYWTSAAGSGAPTRYLSIQSVQRPFPIGRDAIEFETFSVNFQAIADSPVDQWEEELIAILAAEGLATSGTDAFIGRSVNISDLSGDGPHIIVIDTGGTAPIEAHGPSGSLYERLSAQIIVRARDYTVARTRALAIWRALHGVRNETVAA